MYHCDINFDPVISCVKLVNEFERDVIYVEAPSAGASPAKGLLVFVRTRAPCELRSEAETLTGMRDWMQIKHLPSLVSGGSTTAFASNTFQGAAGIIGIVSTGTRPSALTAAGATPFVVGALTAGAEDYYLFLF